MPKRALALKGDLYAPACPSRGVLDHVTSRWGVLVLDALLEGTHRFSELRRRIGGVSEKMPAQTLQALQQVLFYRELGFPLEEIGRILLDPKRDARAALLAQRELLKEKAQHFAALVRSVDEAISSLEKGTTMNPEKMFEGFDPSQYEEE